MLGNSKYRDETQLRTKKMGAKKWRSVGYVKHTRRFLAVVLHWSVSLSHEHSMRHFFPLHYSSDSNRKNKQQKRWKERKKGHDFTLNAPPSNMLVEARTPSCSTNQLQQLKQKQSKKKKKTVTTTITTTRSLRSAKVWGVLKAVIDENSSNTTTTGYFEIM